jgi:subtilisin family serine protease
LGKKSDYLLEEKMKRKSIVFTLVLIILLMATSLSAIGKKEVRTYSQDDLYVPDLVDAQLESELSIGAALPTSLPIIKPFWTDLVDTENVLEDGDGVYVAVLDTGLLPDAPFFLSNANIAWELGIGFTHDITWDNDIMDLAFGPVRDDRGYWTDLASGHGTHVSSTIVGFNYNNIFWISGVAPKATIIPVLVLDAWEVDSPFGTLQLSGGTDEMISEGIYYVADLAETLDGPVVINMSLGGPTPTPMIEDAIDYAIDKGVIIVASAGNEGMDGMGWPGAYPQVISCAAAGWAQMFAAGWAADVPENLKTKDPLGNTFQIYLEDFSSRPNKYLGQKHKDLDVATPGAWVVGPYKPAFSTNPLDIGYWYLSGTSMAAPHVSAISALVLQDFPDMTQKDMEFNLKLAAQSMPIPASDAFVDFSIVGEGAYYTAIWDGGDFGAGFLQAPAALDFADILD